MSTLKQLRLRIAGVKSTQKITKTMKMVAASKLTKAQHQKDSAKPYADKLHDMLNQLVDSVEMDANKPNLLLGNGQDKQHLIIVISSDRGLCGGFNTSLAKNLRKQINAFLNQGKECKIICLGKKVYDQIKGQFGNYILEVLPGYSTKKLTYSDANKLALKIIDLFEQGTFDHCHVLYNEFKNILKQVVKFKRLIPLQRNENESVLAVHSYEFEPCEEKILKQILPLNLAAQLYYLLLESIASEHGSRMTAMDSASNNAADMIAKLTLKYNRTRQASITKELIEIVSSAEVV